jgi:STE24 endopeptidase
MTIQIITYLLITFSYCFSLWLNILNYKNRNKSLPEEVSDIYNKEDYQKWLVYYMKRFRFSIIAKTITTIIFVTLLASGFFNFIDKIANNITANQAFEVVIFLGFYYIVNFIVGIFLDYYSTFVIEAEFGFNKSTIKTFVFDKIKSLILTSLVFGSIIYGLATLYIKMQDMFFLYAFIGSVLFILITNIIYTKIIVPIFNKLKPLEDGTLKSKIEDFAKSVGYEINKISVMDASRRSTKLNAFFSGFGKFKQVVLYDTLIEKMTEDEVIAVLAHEIGHNKHRNIIYNILQSLVMVLLVIGLVLVMLNNSIFSTSFNFDSTNFGFVIILFTILITPITLPIDMLTSYISRKFEYQADAYAAINFSKKAMIDSLKVISRENFSHLTPHPLLVKITYSHPTTADRIKAINRL